MDFNIIGDNSILKTLQKIYKDYLFGEEELSKINCVKFFFEYNILDTCGYNIFELNNFLKQLNPDGDKITLKMFLILIFYIYKKQMETKDDNDSLKENKDSINELSIDEVNKLSTEPKNINEAKNIIKLINDRVNKKKNIYKYLSPDFSKEEIKKIIDYDLLNFVSKYMLSIENEIFDKYSSIVETSKKENKDEEDKEFKLLNISKFNNFIFDYPVFKNFDCESITNYLSLFIKEFQDNNNIEKIRKAFDEKLEYEPFKELFKSFYLNSDEINFSYSGLIILLIQFCLKLNSSKSKDYQDSITFFLEKEFELKPDQIYFDEQVEENQEKEIDYDFIPDSKTLQEAKQLKFTEEESEFILEVLENLDKALPPIDKNVLQFANDKPTHSNTLYTNPYKVIPALFPLEKLQVEIDEKNALDLANYENRRIDRAKKNKKRNARDPIPKEIYMDELPNKKVIDERYMGKLITNTLTDLTIKNTFKEIVSNSKVYPSIIKESLILPKDLPEKIKELVIESYESNMEGNVEFAIRRLEKAELALKDLKALEDNQTDLFFRLTFGSYYQDLNLNTQAMKYYMNAKKISDKISVEDPFSPDNALVYCYLGSLFLNLKEFEWSFRCFQLAKEIREKIIGGDTLDTASIYNNLGVVSFYMESFLPAKNYMNLAYEITRSILGLMHPRTLMIKSNISKLNQLSFNKEVVFKTLSKYPTLEQLIQNPKRKKKGKKKKKKKK